MSHDIQGIKADMQNSKPFTNEPFNMEECEKKSQITNDTFTFKVLQVLRNGAVVVGDDIHTNAYRQHCLEVAYYMTSTYIAPELMADGYLEDTNAALNVIDTSALIQQGLIRPDLAARYWTSVDHIIIPLQPLSTGTGTATDVNQKSFSTVE